MDYPIVLEEGYPLSRNQLYDKLAQHNIFTRKYFYPPCTDYECYKDMPSVRNGDFTVLNRVKEKVLCLPFYGGLSTDQTERICDYICKP